MRCIVVVYELSGKKKKHCISKIGFYFFLVRWKHCDQRTIYVRATDLNRCDNITFWVHQIDVPFFFSSIEPWKAIAVLQRFLFYLCVQIFDQKIRARGTFPSCVTRFPLHPIDTLLFETFLSTVSLCAI